MPLDDTYEHEAARANATMRLAFARIAAKDLGRAEAQARLDLAATIIALDEAEALADENQTHTLHEQLAVETAKNDYAQALADLLRREAHE